MIGSEQRSTTSEERKAKIRERYKGIDPNELDVIPAIKPADFYSDNSSKRVAVYARVSTDDPNQTSSYELQKNHYTDVVSRHEGWELSKIYADEGISGTSLQHRDAFIQMIEDCKSGKIDLIITKSVSRFARNIIDCIGYIRSLAQMQPPIGVFFETENIYTLNPNSEMSLSFISTLAQEESHNKSEIMNASIEMRFRRGIFLTPPLLGYDLDEDGNLVINEIEANSVRLMFFMYLYGYTCTKISETLTELGCRTKKGNIKWTPGAVLKQLENERHCGDVLARKTFTPNYLDHKSKKNNHNRNQYLKRNHHAAIISRDDFIAVQRLISNAKYGGNKILPRLHVIDDGVLKGFVIVNPKWSGFTVNDYIEACESVYEEGHEFTDDFQVTAEPGEFDLRGFEVARSEYFDVQMKTSLTFTHEDMRFSSECLKKLPKTVYIEMLIHPRLNLLVVRPAQKNSKCAIKWCVLKDLDHQPKIISAKAVLPTIYEMFDWDTDCKYSVRGSRKSNGNEMIMYFKMDETEMFYQNKSDNTNDKPRASKKAETIHGYPMHWASHFGDEYYRKAQIDELLAFTKNKTWNTSSEGKPYSSEELEVKQPDELEKEINDIITTIKKADDKNE